MSDSIRRSSRWAIAFGVFLFGGLFLPAPSFSDEGRANWPAVALDLRGESTFVALPEPVAAVPNTFEAWIQIAEHESGRIGVIAGNYQSGHRAGTINWEIHRQGAMRMFWDHGNPNLISSQAELSGGRWYHVAFVRDPEAGEFRFYLDGELAQRFDRIGAEVALTDHPQELRLRIGADYPETRMPFNGLIADVRLWSHARTAAEIRDNRGRRLSGSEEGLIGYWPLDDASGSEVRDRAGSNHGRVEGVPRWTLTSLPRLQNQEYRAGESITLGPVQGFQPQGEPSYQWFLNDRPISGATGDRLTIDGVEPRHKGSYHVQVDDDHELTPVISNRVTLLEPDWPMWRFDAARSASFPFELPETLQLQWVRQLPEPQRAWHPQWDHIGKLDFDISYSPVVMGERIFVPSNVTDSVTAYAIDDGRQLWRYYADGPVRLAPVAWEDKVYFVSDDGHLYCVTAAEGELLWRFAAGPSDARLLGNERIVSFWTARGGPVIEQGTLYFAAGIWPLHGVFLYALDAESGEVVWVNDTTSSDYVQLPHGSATGYGGLAPQGYLAVSQDTLIVAGGRTPPAYLDRHTGEVQSVAFRSKGGGDYAVHGVDGGGTGRRRNPRLQAQVEALADQIDGQVFEKLAARDRLFVTTHCGRLYCFGEQPISPQRYEFRPTVLTPRTDRWAATAGQLLSELGESAGYALMLGAGSGDLARELLGRSQLHVVIVEADGELVQQLRDELVSAGMYGRRAAVIEADPATFSVQPYLFSLVLSEDAGSAGIVPQPEVMKPLLDRLRPYGGLAWLGESSAGVSELVDAGRTAAVDQVVLEPRETHLFARRTGPLTGAGQWTHQYADASQSNFSPDQRVQLPLGVLWFGGPCNRQTLPRHGGHGPLPQVAGGRVIVPGVETISARCVYTGRELWTREFPGIGHPFTNLELEARYEQGASVFMVSRSGVGAVKLGSPFVSLPDGIYVRYKTRIYRLQPDSGDVMATFQLPVPEPFAGQPDWGHFSIAGDRIITTIEPQVFGEARDYTEAYDSLEEIVRSSRFEPLSESFDEDAWDGTSSNQLVVLDRHSGDVLWTRRARVGFRHNAITSGGGRLYLVDGLSRGAIQRLQRRGKTVDDATLLALDPQTGETIWERDTGIFGTWLSYAEPRDTLLEGGHQGGTGGRSRLPDEPNDRVAAYRGATGEPLWSEALERYHGPISLRGETIYLAPAGSTGRGRALNLLTGEPELRDHADEAWSYQRRYGCNTQNVSQHLITFRSGYAAYYDLAHDSGTGFFAGFRSGCANNLIAADGVLNAPDYTRTCTCSYANQTSLALVPMPEDTSIEAWTKYDGAPPDPEGYGINFGAPGRRVDRTGTGRIWYDQPGTHRRHASALQDAGDSLDWVAASQRAGSEPITIQGLRDTTYTVRLHFAELDARVGPDQRVFQVLLQGETVLSELDIVQQAGGAFRGLVKTFSATPEDGQLTIGMRPAAAAEHPPVISGIELIAESVESKEAIARQP